MQRRRAGHARFAGLAGNIDAHAELSHSLPASTTARDAAELDRLQADPARGLDLVMAPDVIQRMNAFVGADCDVGGRRDRCHAGKVVADHRLLEKVEA